MFGKGIYTQEEFKPQGQARHPSARLYQKLKSKLEVEGQYNLQLDRSHEQDLTKSASHAFMTHNHTQAE